MPSDNAVSPYPPTLALKGLPGTGKTTALLDLLETHLESGGGIDTVAASTFRRLMAREFRERAEEVVGGDLPDDHHLRTTHSLCYRLLGLEAVDVVDEERREEFFETLDGVAYDRSYELTTPPEESREWFDATTDTGAVGNDLLYVYSVLRNTLCDPATEWRSVNMTERTREKVADTGGRLVPFFIDAYEEFKRDRGLVDFDDMLEEVLRRGLTPNVDLLLEDEFQDKTPLQLKVYNQWAADTDRVVVAGDAFQAIYDFLGTDPAFFETAYERAETSRLLDTSYRFGADLWRAATGILERAGYDVPTIDPVGSTDIHQLSWDGYRDVVRTVPEDEAFHLSRANYYGGEVVDVLHRAGIPFRSKFGTSWTDVQIDLFNGVSQVARAFEEAEVLTTPTVILHEREAYRLVDALPADAVNGTKVDWRERLDAESATTIEGDRLLTWAEVGPLLNTARPFDGLLSSALTSTTRRRLNDAYGARDGRRIQSVSHVIETAHGSKGREADHVFLLDATTNRIRRSAAPETEARVFFVAATRARKHLWVVDPPSQYPRFGLHRVLARGVGL